jgi:hypothetical protein
LDRDGRGSAISPAAGRGSCRRGRGRPWSRRARRRTTSTTWCWSFRGGMERYPHVSLHLAIK